MPQIVWEESYSVKVAELDRQHEDMINIINTCDNAIRSSNPESYIIEVLEGLQKFTNEHFELEERLMREANYEKLGEHLNEHRKFMSIVNNYSTYYQLGVLPLLTHIMEFLNDWFLNHLLVYDKEYADSMNRAGINQRSKT